MDIHGYLVKWQEVIICQGAEDTFFLPKQHVGDQKVFLCLSAAAVALVLVACGWQQSLLALAALAVFMRRGV